MGDKLLVQEYFHSIMLQRLLQQLLLFPRWLWIWSFGLLFWSWTAWSLLLSKTGNSVIETLTSRKHQDLALKGIWHWKLMMALLMVMGGKPSLRLTWTSPPLEQRGMHRTIEHQQNMVSNRCYRTKQYTIGSFWYRDSIHPISTLCLHGHRGNVQCWTQWCLLCGSTSYIDGSNPFFTHHMNIRHTVFSYRFDCWVIISCGQKLDNRVVDETCSHHVKVGTHGTMGGLYLDLFYILLLTAQSLPCLR